MTTTSSFEDLYEYIGDGIIWCYRSKVNDLLEFEFTCKNLHFTRLGRIIKNEPFENLDDMKDFMVSKHNYYVYLIESIEFLDLYGSVSCLRCDTFTFSNEHHVRWIRDHIDGEHPFRSLIKSASKE